MEYLISTDRAMEILLPYMSPRGAERLNLTETYGRVSASDVYSDVDIPAYDSAAVNGFAISAPNETREYRLNYNSTLTTESDAPLEAGYALRVQSGEPVPPDAYAVVPYESTEFAFDKVRITGIPIRGAHINRSGSTVKRGVKILADGKVISPIEVESIAAQGISELDVYRKPRAGIISTGSELIEPESGRITGRTFDSNRYMLESFLHLLGYDVFFLGTDRADDTQTIADLINSGRGLDIMFSTGGVGNGERDYMTSAYDAMGAYTLTWGGAFRPYGTFALAMLGVTPLVGLPGNPKHALLALRLLFLPALKRLCGRTDTDHKRVKAISYDRISNSGDTAYIHRGKLVHSSAALMVKTTSGDDYDCCFIAEPGADYKVGATLEVYCI